MPIYKQTTEITNIDDLLSSVERDIEEVYFGDKQVFTAWAEYDGTLLAQYSANGDYLADYRIYGASGGAGDRTENLFDKDAHDTANGYVAGHYINSSGTIAKDDKWDVTEYIPCIQQNVYCFSNCVGAIAAICWYDSNKNYISGSPIQSPTGFKTLVMTAPINASYIRTCVLLTRSGGGSQVYERNVEVFMVNIGSTAPASYSPYGYEVDMSVRPVNLIDVAQTNYGTDYYAGGLHWEITGQSVALSETSNTTYPQSFLLNSEGNALQLAAGKKYYAKLFVENAPAGSSIYIFLRKKIAEAWNVAYTINTNGVVIIAPTDVEEWSWLLVAQGNGITYNNTRIRVEVSESPIIEYVPYSKTVTPIYIGAEPLGEDEYIDYKSGKIYRMSESVLTPTDPPVPLPALPTIDGVNIINYAGQSAAVPSRFYAKYRKQNF